MASVFTKRCSLDSFPPFLAFPVFWSRSSSVNRVPYTSIDSQIERIAALGASLVSVISSRCAVMQIGKTKALHVEQVRSGEAGNGPILLTSTALSCPPLPISDNLEADILATCSDGLHTAGVEPSLQILALANIEEFEVPAAFNYGFNTRACDTNAATHGKLFKLEEM